MEGKAPVLVYYLIFRISIQLINYIMLTVTLFWINQRTKSSILGIAEWVVEAESGIAPYLLNFLYTSNTERCLQKM